MRVLTRMWQMLLKSLEEVALAPNAMMAAEMAVIRLTHVADLPSPEDLLRKLQDTPRPATPPAPPPAPQGDPGPRAIATRMGSGAAPALAAQPDNGLVRFATFDTIVDLIRANRDAKLLIEVETCLQLAAYTPGRIEFVPTDSAPRDLAARLSQRLQLWTGARWAVTLVNTGGAPTISALRNAETDDLKSRARAHPLMQAVLLAFPGAEITDIRTPEALSAQAAEQALPGVDDEWDPFEND